ncbi:MAG: DUF1302 family protein [Nevskia sp.]|nr:DUF1302 family protein [Nevskia sp.]
MLAVLPVVPARALDFNFTPPFGNEPVKAVLNTTVTAGVGIRMESPSTALIGKGDLNPQVCAPPYQDCQGLFRTQTYTASHMVAAPGSASNNGDQGDLNYYHKYDIFQSPLKLTQDLTLTYHDFGFFGRALYFYDVTNNDFTEYHPNEITPQNLKQVGRFGSTAPIPALNTLAQDLLKAGIPESALSVTALIGRFYGPGGVVYSKRTDPVVLKQAGTALQYLDSYFFGKLPLWGDHDLSFKIGRQLVNWGESTTLQINSINSANPINANNFYRIGAQVEEVFQPVNMLDLSFSPFGGATVEGFYQLEWQPTQAPAPGTYFSDIDVGTNNAGPTSLNASFGTAAKDPYCIGRLTDNPLSGLTPTCIAIFRLPDWKPRTAGQYGLKFDYYSDSINNGTDFSFYYEQYHSRLPYVSVFGAYPSCLRREGNARSNDAIDIISTLQDCPHIPLLTIGNPAAARNDALMLDTSKYVLEYPEDIHLLGLSFNTTVGAYSLQGEVAYRPNKPMQVDAHDLLFASLGHSGAACDLHGVQCEGTSGPLSALGVGGVGNGPDGGTAFYGSSDAVNQSGRTYSTDTYNLIIGHAAGSQRYFPNFIIPYRGGVVGENTPCYPQQGSADETQFGFNTFQHPYYPYNRNSPCYIRGYERLQDFQFNLGATRVYGNTENPIGADQVTLLYELGAEYVPFLPPYDRLVLQGPNSTYGPTAGADGSGADGSRMGCSNIPDCSYGPDGIRFNPHQQDHSGYPTYLSWGYRVISQVKYEQILPGFTLTPIIVWQQDVGGISPEPGGNFVKGRKQMNTLFELRYHQPLSLSMGYTWYWGGGGYNTLSDRDYAQVFLKYQF